MILTPVARNELQDRLDETRLLEDAIPDDDVAAELLEQRPFVMSGLYEIIPGAQTAPLRIDLRQR